MKYYKVLPEHDQKPRYKFKRGGGSELDGIYIRNELYTPNEIKKYLDYARHVVPVEIPKNQIYFLFGARFQKGVI